MWVETPSNPLLKIVDIEAVAAVAHAARARVVVDNTFATPALQRPLALGADVVVHSVHEVPGRALRPDRRGHRHQRAGSAIERLGFLTNAIGAVPGPMDSYLGLRGLKTLGVRMRPHCANAAAVAGFLADHPDVGQVYYPAWTTTRVTWSPHAQMAGFGGMVSFTVGTPPRRSTSAAGPSSSSSPNRSAGWSP